MLHTVAYTDSTSAAQTDTDIPVVTPDPSVAILNKHPIFPKPVWPQWIYGLGLTMTRVRLSTPRLKPVTRVAINPIDQSATPTENLRLFEYWRRPILLNPIEEVQFLRTNTTAVAEQDFVVLTVGDNMRNIPPGDMYVMRATTAFSPTANAWSAGTITNDDVLQPGRYSIVGTRVNNSGGVAARWIFPGAPVVGAPIQIRPGVKVDQSVTQEGTWWMRYGMMGEYGQFENVALPTIEMLVATVTANPEIFYDIVDVRVGASY